MGSDDLFKRQKAGEVKKSDKLRKELKDSILIVCEGEKTEPNYFRSFPVAGVKVEVLGEGRNTLSLIEKAGKYWKRMTNEGKFYETLWCVMDRDSFPKCNYDNSFNKIKALETNINKRYKKKLVKEFKANIAYSNEAFEIWYMLHYEYYNTSISRDRYIRLLSDKMGISYKKNSQDIYERLEALNLNTDGKNGLGFALKNAEKLRASISLSEVHRQNPSTTVDLLVKELKRHCK